MQFLCMFFFLFQTSQSTDSSKLLKLVFEGEQIDTDKIEIILTKDEGQSVSLMMVEVIVCVPGMKINKYKLLQKIDLH